MTQLTGISPLKTFVVFLRSNLKPCVNVAHEILDAIDHETVNVNSLMNIRNTVDIYQN